MVVHCSHMGCIILFLDLLTIIKQLLKEAWIKACRGVMLSRRRLQRGILRHQYEVIIAEAIDSAVA